MTAETPYPLATERRHSGVREQDIEAALVEKLRELKYTERPDIRDRATLEANFRQKFETLNRVRLTDGEFARLLDELVTRDVFATVPQHPRGVSGEARLRSTGIAQRGCA